MNRFVISVFKEKEIGSAEYLSTLRGRHRQVFFPVGQREVNQNVFDGMCHKDTVMFFAVSLAEAQEFAQSWAAEKPGYACCISEITEMYRSERPTVAHMSVNEKGVLPK